MPPSRRKASSVAELTCTICATTVSRKADMTRHLKIHATNKKDLEYGCPYFPCSFSSMQRANVITHIMTHTGEKPHTCPDYDYCNGVLTKCPFRTGDPGSLTRHRKRRHGYKPKEDKGFRQRGPTRTTALKPISPKVRHAARFEPYQSTRENTVDSLSNLESAATNSSSSSSHAAVSDLPSFSLPQLATPGSLPIECSVLDLATVHHPFEAHYEDNWTLGISEFMDASLQGLPEPFLAPTTSSGNVFDGSMQAPCENAIQASLEAAPLSECRDWNFLSGDLEQEFPSDFGPSVSQVDFEQMLNEQAWDASPFIALPPLQASFDVPSNAPSLGVPSFEVPSFEMPSFEVPSLEVPSFEVPSYDPILDCWSGAALTIDSSGSDIYNFVPEEFPSPSPSFPSFSGESLFGSQFDASLSPNYLHPSDAFLFQDQFRHAQVISTGHQTFEYPQGY